MAFNPQAIKRFFDGKYTRDDYLSVKRIFSDPTLRILLINYLEKHWNELELEQPEAFEAGKALNRLHQKIIATEIKPKKVKYLDKLQQIAVILFIPLILSFVTVLYLFVKNPAARLYPNAAYAQIQCPEGVRTKFQLPDGSVGFLNGGSTLTYPVDFAQGRSVKLVGEAFFDIKHNEEKPFVVETQNIDVKVLGTRFDVISYSGGKREEVILTSGRVDVYDKEGKKMDVLEPNTKIVVDKTSGSFRKTEVDAAQYTGWTNGKIILRNECFSDVIERLERWYNVTIEIRDDELNIYSFRATFKDEPIEEVLKMLALTAPFNFEEQPREIKHDTYEKRKFILWMDEKRVNAFR